jgi:cytochrome c553
MTMLTKSILVLGLVSVIGGGAYAANEPAKAAEPAAAAKPADSAKKIDWDHMSKADKKKYMKSTVLPAAKKLFAEFDAKKYKKVTCQTCHGAKATETEFKMPTAELPKLPQPTDRAAFEAIGQKKPEVVKFMGTKVKPGIAALLGKEEWTPQNPTGYGCYGCHTKEGGDAPAKEPGVAKDSAAKPPAMKEAAGKEPAKK